MTDEIRKLQVRAEEIALAAVQEDIANNVADMVYIVIATRQTDAESFALGSYCGHTTAVTVDPSGVKLILKTALETVGHEIPS